MEAWSLSLPNVRYGAYMPNEDSLLYGKGVFCVADGVTRDPIGTPNFADKSTEEALRGYPRPSPATQAAEICTQTFIEQLEDTEETNVGAAMSLCNEKIAELNRGLVCDYLENDFAGCVAAGAKIVKDTLLWASIGDCRISVFSKNGTRKFTSTDGTENWVEYEKHHPNNWSNPEYRVTVRKEFRNTKRLDNGKLVSFGVLTGESSAETFIQNGEVKLDVGDIIAFYTDGCAPYVSNNEFFEKVWSKEAFIKWQDSLAHENPDRFGKERTIIVVKI